MKNIRKKFIALILAACSLFIAPSPYVVASSNQQLSSFCAHRGYHLSSIQCNHLYKILNLFVSSLKKNKAMGKSLSYLQEKKLAALEKLFNNEPLKHNECFLIDTIINDIIKQ